MTAQPPLPLSPVNAREMSPAVSLVEDQTGGRVFIHGELSLLWDVGDVLGRRHAAVTLVRIGAAKPGQVAAAFGIGSATLRRWRGEYATGGAAGLLAQRRGPKGPSKATGDLPARIRARRGRGE
jgi:hypothetical protein